MWVTPKAEVVREAAGTQSAMTYIGRRQGTAAQWVALRPIFEVEAFYEGGGRRREAWFRKEVPDTHLRATLEEISREARRRRRGKSNMQ